VKEIGGMLLTLFSTKCSVLSAQICIFRVTTDDPPPSNPLYTVLIMPHSGRSRLLLWILQQVDSLFGSIIDLARRGLLGGLCFHGVLLMGRTVLTNYFRFLACINSSIFSLRSAHFLVVWLRLR